MSELFRADNSGSERNFEDLVKSVEGLLDNPDFATQVNQKIIISCVVDGQRTYTQHLIDLARRGVLEARTDGFSFEPNSLSDILARGIAKATYNFSKNGSFRLEGYPVFKFVDRYLFDAAENNYDLDDLSFAAEGLISGAIGIGFGVPFESYQTDIAIAGQGLLTDTYFMDIQFRPISKNVKA